jgi:hypothetical protein
MSVTLLRIEEPIQTWSKEAAWAKLRELDVDPEKL